MCVFVAAVFVVLFTLGSLAAGVAVTGTVVDPAGAAIPGASVELVSAGKVVATVVSGADGRFNFPNISPGAYQIRVTLAGFQQTRVSLAVGTTAPPPVKVKLLVGSTTESVIVNEAAPVIDRAI